jgi:dihydroneopterin aldolase
MIRGTCFVRDLATECRIGWFTVEREATQPILISVSCEVDMAAAAASDERADTVDYAELQRIALECAAASRYRLLEALAEQIARQVLDGQPQALSVTVEIRKPNKLPGSREVGISLTLEKGTRA